MKILGVIPARYASTRFPGKPLANILGKSMIQHVVEQCEKTNYLSKVIVATDDERIFNEVQSFGGHCVMTSENHRNGTERCHEVALTHTEFDYIVNIQGDEPLIAPNQIDDLCQSLINQTPQIATMVRKMTNKTQVQSPHVVKCVRSQSGKAIYFSRSAVPYHQEDENFNYYQHIGIYAYQKNILNQLVNLSPSTLEKIENLEQLRWIENQYSILTIETEHDSIGVDIPEDIDKIIERLA